MKYLDYTFPSPNHNLACDEALLLACEAGGAEVLRFWESPARFVVLGQSNAIAREVNLEACRARGVPVCRRISGGGTVVQGPGCLNYALAVRIGRHEALGAIGSANAFVLNRHKNVIQSLTDGRAEVLGISDLALDGRKISGNAQRRKRNALLFHGTFLFGADLDLIAELLPMPPKQPDYRANRSHSQFLTNLDIPAETLKNRLREVWGADEPLLDIPRAAIDELAAKKYSLEEWINKF